MEKMSKRLGLLEDIQTQIGCLYLSDLRVDPCINKAAREELLKLNREDYSNEEWAGTITYLFGKRETDNSD